MTLPASLTLSTSYSFSSHLSNSSMERKQSALGSVRSIFGRKSSRAADTHAATHSPANGFMDHSNNPPAGPPPAYTKQPTTAPASSSYRSPSPAVASSSASASAGSDSRYDFLRSFDTIFLIDDSGSMAGSRWREVSQALEAITPICVAYDADGIDIRFLNTPPARVHSNITEASTVHEIFSTVRPSGGTPTGQCLHRLLKEHLAAYAANPRARPKPVNIIVITDGEPSDDVESPIIAAARKLDAMDAEPWQVGVQFVQVGGDLQAKAHLESLDDALAEMGGGCRDIVDTVPFLPGRGLDADLILKVVLGAVNKRLDRKKNVAR